MKVCIAWTIFLHVSTDAKCVKALDKIRHALGLPLDVGRSESYWKDNQFYRVLATTCIDAASAKDGFYEIMKAVNGLARFWTVNGPNESGGWEFSGTATPGSTTIQEIDSISFSSIETQSQSHSPIATHA